METPTLTRLQRRRTQIRLAQRAYRNRKDTAIQTLEKKVQQLKDNNEEMSNAFMQLHDFALSSGLLDRIPDFGRQLRQTTERFLSLAREASDEEKDDEPKASTAASTGPSNGRDRSHSPTSPSVTAETTSPEPDRADARPKSLLWGGLTVTHEPATHPDFNTPPIHQHPPPPLPAYPFEIVTHPTLENASFAFPQPTPFSSTIHYPTPPVPSYPSPWPYLASPATYSSQESTFGRRLQRYASERALILISAANPSPAALTRVFGFCLLMESPQTIRNRLRRVLGHDAQQSLMNWQFPFYNLGGAGTHRFASPLLSAAAQQQSVEGGGTRMGNQGTVDVMKPSATAGFATGPFDAAVSEVRERDLDMDMRMAVQGFAGEFFDCDEAEMYLFQRGVTIYPGEDVVTADVDPAAFFGGVADNGSGAGGSVRSSTGGVVLESSGESEASGGEGVGEVQDAVGAETWGSLGGGGGGAVDPALGGAFGQGNPFLPTPASSLSTPGLGSAPSGSNALPFGMLAPAGTGNSGLGLNMPQRGLNIPQRGPNMPQPGPNLQRVVIDVQRLVRGTSCGTSVVFPSAC